MRDRAGKTRGRSSRAPSSASRPKTWGLAGTGVGKWGAQFLFDTKWFKNSFQSEPSCEEPCGPLRRPHAGGVGVGGWRPRCCPHPRRPPGLQALRSSEAADLRVPFTLEALEPASLLELGWANWRGDFYRLLQHCLPCSWSPAHSQPVQRGAPGGPGSGKPLWDGAGVGEGAEPVLQSRSSTVVARSKAGPQPRGFRGAHAQGKRTGSPRTPAPAGLELPFAWPGPVLRASSPRPASA